MEDTDKNRQIVALQQRLSEAEARKSALREEMLDLSARLPEIRRAFGNPFFYSHPEEPDEGIANYSGGSSHEISWPTFRELKRVDRELATIKDELRKFGVLV